MKGLVDYNSDEEFEREFLRLVEIWKEMPKGEDFINYMKKHKKQLIKQFMLASTRERCGLGSPPKDYNQNANEAINSMIKRAKGPNKLSMREAVQLMQQEVSGQDEKVKPAIIGKGKLIFWDYYFIYYRLWASKIP